MAEGWQKELDISALVGTVLMALSKTYDCLPHDLLIAKSEAYGLSKSSLNLLLDYLTSHKQRVKIGSSYSEWNEIKRGVPQGSVLGSLVFNVFINDIFMFIEKSDNTIYDCGEDLSNILENLKHDMKILLKWFRINTLQANPGKFQFKILGKKNRNSVKLIINSIEIEESEKVVLLGITTDDLLTFNEHIDNLCRTANYKLYALRRIRKYLSLEKAKLLWNSFINSQFNYAPLVWLFCRKKNNIYRFKRFTKKH